MTRVTKDDATWRAELTPEQYAVCRCSATEPPFTGRHWNEKRAGTYACACCGTTLFLSATKYDSGSGWPSFYAPAAEDVIAEKTDHTLGMTRVETLCAVCDAHLGHLFPDGPKPTGMRYCINSAALTFTPL